jgi:hypothetical protein
MQNKIICMAEDIKSCQGGSIGFTARAARTVGLIAKRLSYRRADRLALKCKIDKTDSVSDFSDISLTGCPNLLRKGNCDRIAGQAFRVIPIHL